MERSILTVKILLLYFGASDLSLATSLVSNIFKPGSTRRTNIPAKEKAKEKSPKSEAPRCLAM